VSGEQKTLLYARQIVASIPFRKLPQAFSQRCFRCKAKVPFQSRGVRKGGRDIPGLHRHEFLVRLKVKALGQPARPQQLFLKYLDEIQQVHGIPAADVIERVWRDRKTVFAIPFFRGLGHHSNDAFHYVIDVGEIATAVAVVEDLDRLAFEELVGEAEVSLKRRVTRLAPMKLAAPVTNIDFIYRIDKCSNYLILLYTSAVCWAMMSQL
jgi:hypothetical protein